MNNKRPNAASLARATSASHLEHGLVLVGGASPELVVDLESPSVVLILSTPTAAWSGNNNARMSDGWAVLILSTPTAEWSGNNYATMSDGWVVLVLSTPTESSVAREKMRGWAMDVGVTSISRQYNPVWRGGGQRTEREVGERGREGERERDRERERERERERGVTQYPGQF